MRYLLLLALFGALAVSRAERSAKAVVRNGLQQPDSTVAAIRPGGATKVSGGKLSNSGAVFSIFKNIVGAGMLALPSGVAASKGTGVAPAMVLTIAICLISSRTFGSFGRSIEMSKATSFQDLWARTIGPKSTWVVTLSVLLLSFGALLAYGCVIGDVFSSLVPSLSRTNAIIGISAVALLPLILARDLSALSWSSILGFGAVVYTSAFVVLRYFDGSCAPGGRFFDSLPFPQELGQVSTARISAGTLILVNMLLTAFMAHMNGPRFYLELEEKTPENFQAIANKAFGLAALVYFGIICAGYATFGKASQGVILNNYSGDDRLAFVSRFANGISVITSFPLLFTSARDSLLGTLENTKVGRAVASSDRNWRLFSVGMLVAVVLMATNVTDIGFVISVQGSLIGAALCFIIPSLIYLGAVQMVNRDFKRKRPWQVLAGTGGVLAVFGTIISVLESFTDMLE